MPVISQRISSMVQRHWQWLAFGASLAAIFGESLVAHMRLAADPNVINDDARQQVYPFFRYADSALFRDDLISDYYLACLPWGYRALYMIAGYFDAAEGMSKVVPYLELLITVSMLALAAHRFGGKVGAWLAAALCLGSSVYLSRMAGGLPRSFAFPLLACTLAALAYGRIRWAAFMIPVSAAFYPASAVPGGIALALVLLVLPRSDAGEAKEWSLQQRFTFLTLTALAAALVLLPSMLSSRGYGEVIRPANIVEFPEAGPGGRYGPSDRAPFDPYWKAAVPIFQSAVTGDGEPIVTSAHSWAVARQQGGWLLLGLSVIALGGFLCLARVRDDARRVWMLAVAVVVAHTIAAQIAPYFYLPQRYVMYPVPLLGTLMLATGTVGWLSLWRTDAAARLKAALLLVPGLILLMTFGGYGTPNRGLNTRLAKLAPVFAALNGLPKDTLIAGWPRGMIDSVPYAARRRVLLSFELHQAFHTGYALEMRQRMYDTIAAYYATSLEPVLALRRWGVTHVVVEDRHFRGTPPPYFAPFRRAIESAIKTGNGRFLLPRLAKHGQRLQRGVTLIDLAALQSGRPMEMRTKQR